MTTNSILAAAAPGRSAVLGALLCVASIAAGAKVIGDDDRGPPGPAERQLVGALGLIVCSATEGAERFRSAGTGTVVGSRRTVLTSAHVLIDDEAGTVFRFDPARDCRFRRYDAAGALIDEAGFSRAEMGAFWTNPGRPNQDWAVLRTDRPLAGVTDALDFAGPDEATLDGLRIKMVAYHAGPRSGRDRADQLTEPRIRRIRQPLLSEGRLFGVDYGGFRRLAHTADSERMSSGAALVHTTADGRHVVVGVNRSSAHFGDFNLAVPISVELAEVLASSAWGHVPVPRQRLASAPLR